MTEPVCVECGMTFAQKPQVRPMKFCEKLCYSRYWHKKKLPPFSPVNKSCDVCGTIFLNKRRNGRYCSPSCYTVAWSRQHLEENQAKAKSWSEQHPEQVKARYRIYRNRDADSRPWRYLLRSAKMRAVEKNMPFDIDETWAKARWTGCCEITRIPFRVNAINGPLPFSASIDRKESALGYTQTNSRFILWGCNGLKGSGTDADMREIAEAIFKASHTRSSRAPL